MAQRSDEACKEQPELAVQRYLRTGHNSPAFLVEQYKLVTKRHPEHPNLHLFKYIQGKSQFKHDIVRECRGIVLDERDNWRAVCMPYVKFFNYAEKFHDEIDWATAKVLLRPLFCPHA